MTIRSGSKGTKDPAAANWDRVFGPKPPRADRPVVPIRLSASHATGVVTEPFTIRPAELDPEDGA